MATLITELRFQAAPGISGSPALSCIATAIVAIRTVHLS
jgi:hypothetical protein